MLNIYENVCKHTHTYMQQIIKHSKIEKNLLTESK